MTSRYVITESVTSTGNSLMRFMSWSWQPPFAVTKTDSLSNMLRVQKGQQQRMDTVTYMVQ